MTRAVALLVSTLPFAFAANVPRTSPEYAFTLSDGQPALLTQYKGKVIALEFLLTTCPHCQTASKIMEKLYRGYSSRGFLPIGVAINPPPKGVSAAQHVADYARALGLTYPVGFGTSDSAVVYLQHPAMLRMLMPQLVFVDRNGVIQAQFHGADPFFEEAREEANMRDMIEKLLGLTPKKAPAKKAAPAAGKAAPAAPGKAAK